MHKHEWVGERAGVELTRSLPWAHVYRPNYCLVKKKEEQQEQNGKEGRESGGWDEAVIFLPSRKARVGRTARIVVGQTPVFVVHVTVKEKNIIVNIASPFTVLKAEKTSHNKTKHQNIVVRRTLFTESPDHVKFAGNEL